VGLDAAHASLGLSLMQVSVAVGVFIGGPLIDRFGPKVLAATVLSALSPVIVVFARSDSPDVLWLLPLAGVLTGVPLAMTFVIGQSLLTTGKGLASGLLFATSSIAGAAGVALTGAIAERLGLVTALTWLGLLALIGGLASAALPRPRTSPGPQG
ncbi:MAG: MFS transporter, partial [Planctomycetaceae bacterium]